VTGFTDCGRRLPGYATPGAAAACHRHLYTLYTAQPRATYSTRTTYRTWDLRVFEHILTRNTCVCWAGDLTYQFLTKEGIVWRTRLNIPVSGLCCAMAYLNCSLLTLLLCVNIPPLNFIRPFRTLALHFLQASRHTERIATTRHKGRMTPSCLPCNSLACLYACCEGLLPRLPAQGVL